MTPGAEAVPQIAAADIEAVPEPRLGYANLGEGSGFRVPGSGFRVQDHGSWRRQVGDGPGETGSPPPDAWLDAGS